MAVGCAALLNLLLLATWVWAEWTTRSVVWLGWLLVAGVWSTAAILSFSRGHGPPAKQAVSTEALFRIALSEYLQRSWFEAERALTSLLQQNPRDVEARLMLASLLRHTGRLQVATNQLNRLELLRDADVWKGEIAMERQLVAEARIAASERVDSAMSDGAISNGPTDERVLGEDANVGREGNLDAIDDPSASPAAASNPSRTGISRQAA